MFNIMCDKVMIIAIIMMITIRAVFEGCNLEHMSWLSSLDIVGSSSGKLKVPLFKFLYW